MIFWEMLFSLFETHLMKCSIYRNKNAKNFQKKSKSIPKKCKSKNYSFGHSLYPLDSFLQNFKHSNEFWKH